MHFSFISISTIGFGDIVPKPVSAWHTSVSIMYTTSGFIIMTILITDLLEKLDLLQKAVKPYSFSDIVNKRFENIGKHWNKKVRSQWPIGVFQLSSDDSKFLLPLYEIKKKSFKCDIFPINDADRKPSLPNRRYFQQAFPMRRRSLSLSVL